jgi:TatD DNase family protein
MNDTGKGAFDFLTDSHCHLDDERFGPDFDAVLQRARDAGVGRIVAVNTIEGIEGSRRVVEISRRFDWIDAVVGLHPHDARLFSTDLYEEMERMILSGRVAAVGETGLDYHYDHSPRDRQRDAFREQLRLARRVGKPVVIHTREAEEDTLRILEEEKGWETGGVFHCFSGGPDLAAWALGKGYYLSFSGVITFPRAHGLRSILAAAPADRVLVETDAPYLAPVPKRGKRNEPAYVAYTARECARVRSISEREVWRITSMNAARLFGPGVGFNEAG